MEQPLCYIASNTITDYRLRCLAGAVHLVLADLAFMHVHLL